MLIAAILWGAAPAMGAAVTSTTLGPSAYNLAFVPGNRAYVQYRSGTNGVAVMNATTGALLGRVVTPNGGPGDIAIDPTTGHALAVGGSIERQIWVVNGSTLALETPIPLPIPAYRIAVSAELGRVYVGGPEDEDSSGNQTYSVYAIDLATGAVVGQVQMPTFPQELVVDDAAGRVYVASGSSIGVLDSLTLQPLPTIGMSASVYELAFDEVNGLLYALLDAPSVAIVDTATASVVGSLPSSGAAFGIAVDPGADRVLVMRGNPSVLQVFEGGALVDEITPEGTQPRYPQVNWATGSVWVSDELTGTLSIIAFGPAPPDLDADDDGTLDDIDADGGSGTSPAGSFSDDTGDSFTTTGSVTDTAGLAFTLADAPDPDGVTVTVGPGTGRVTLSVCGGFTLRVNAGSEVVVTCGSVRAQAVSGGASIVLGNGVTVIDIPSGGEAKVSGTEAAGYSVVNLGTTSITVTVDGTQATLPAGGQAVVRTWDFVGFAQPVDNDTALSTVLNRVKAGQTVPLRWRVLDAAGQPVTNLALAQASVASLNCATGTGVDELEQVAASPSGLQNLGDGYYQLNWKSDKSYGGSCKRLRLDIGDGVTHDAAFQFIK